MVTVRYTRNLFLRAFCTVYLSAFLSLYFQAPGLYGENGILPARSVLENSKHKTFSAKIHYQPTLLWLAPYLGLSTSSAIDVLSLFGAFLAFTGIVSQKFCIIPVFTALWSLYFSLYQIGQVFVSNSFDDLLLEAGFLAILVAPLFPSHRKSKKTVSDTISFWLCRWLLFRILFTAAVGKLLSGCPKWWSLSALSHYFETQPLPNPLSWYAHHLPTWILKISTVYTNACELIVPFTFFLPIRAVRITAFHLELFLQTCIVATGNFDHSNILIVTLLLTLLDDKFFYGNTKGSSKWDIIGHICNLALWLGIGYAVVMLYGIKYNDGVLESSITFTKIQFNDIVTVGFPYLTFGGLISLGLTVFYYTVKLLSSGKPGQSKFVGILGVLFYSAVALSLYVSSSIALLSMHPKTNSTVEPLARTFYSRANKAHIVNHYSLFPTITGAEGRPEIVFEGAENLEGPWREYNFLYKPGNVNHSLPFVAPYSPRIDWQLYWAARSTYDKQPWILSLTHRLLTGQTEVLNLLDRKHSPFTSKLPKYIRGVLYKYKYTTRSQTSKPAWWVREKVSEYFPPFSKDSPALEDFLKARNLLPSSRPEEVNPKWKQILDIIRKLTNEMEGTLLFWAIFSAALIIVVSGGTL